MLTEQRKQNDKQRNIVVYNGFYIRSFARVPNGVSPGELRDLCSENAKILLASLYVLPTEKWMYCIEP